LSDARLSHHDSTSLNPFNADYPGYSLNDIEEEKRQVEKRDGRNVFSYGSASHPQNMTLKLGASAKAQQLIETARADQNIKKETKWKYSGEKRSKHKDLRVLAGQILSKYVANARQATHLQSSPFSR
jgi:hypothetical protein